MNQRTFRQNETLRLKRRDFIRKGLLITFSSAAGLTLLNGCKDEGDKDEEKKVSRPEDLMQEHGLLNRVLLI